MTTFTRQFLLAAIAILYLVVAPCAVAMSAMESNGECEHCASPEPAACAPMAEANLFAAGAVHAKLQPHSPAPDDLPASLRSTCPTEHGDTGSGQLAVPAVHDPAARSGRHAGDPSLVVLYGVILE